MTFQQALLRRGVQHRVAAGGKIHLCCPFCPSRGKPADWKFRLCVHTTQGWGRCMHCDWKHRYAVAPVLRQLGITESVTESARREPERESPPVTLPEDFQSLKRAYDDLDAMARKYVLDRGVTPAQIEECRIGVSYVGRYAYRVLFPVYFGEQLKFINARDFTGQQKPKYLNSVGDKYLFHFDPKAETCVLSEGVFKALRIAQVTQACSASLLGHDVTDCQLEQLRASACKELLIYPDPDSVGRIGAAHVIEKLQTAWPGRVQMIWPVALPADEAPFAEIKNHLDSPVPCKWAELARLRLTK